MSSSSLPPNHLYFLGHASDPVVEICADELLQQRIPLSWAGPGRHGDESLWMVDLAGYLPAAEWQFRIDLGLGAYEHPEFAPFYTTALHSLWMQDGQIYAYQPAAEVSPARVIKIDALGGTLSERSLYVYLPRGYDSHPEHRYPVLYMHDGQNCFEAFVDDSFAGSWQADLTADLLIREGMMRECIIAGVSNGSEQRVLEYLPPYSRTMPMPRHPTAAAPPSDTPPPPRRPLRPTPGQADRTFAYYRDTVAPYLRQHFRVMTGREDTATCGSSMGGLFSLYMAWEHPEFARSHAALSTSFWITRSADGTLDAIERLRSWPRRDVRLWLDSGTRSSPFRGNDGMADTRQARRALLEAGYVEGVDFQYYLDEGATHSEAAWAARLPLVFSFLLPA